MICCPTVFSMEPSFPDSANWYESTPFGPGGLTLSAAVVGPVAGAWLALYCTSWPIFSSSVILAQKVVNSPLNMLGPQAAALDGLTANRRGDRFCSLDRRGAEQRAANTTANRTIPKSVATGAVSRWHRARPLDCAFSLSPWSLYKCIGQLGLDCGSD